MAVEAHHLSLFPSLVLPSRDLVNANREMYNPQMEPGFPFGRITPEALVPFYQSAVSDAVPAIAKTSMKSDSGLTHAVPAPRKRPREVFDGLNEAFSGSQIKSSRLSHDFSSFLGDDISIQIQQQQSEIDRIVAEHTEKLKLELDEGRKLRARMLIMAIQDGMTKKLKEKDEEIQRMGKLNWALQERVKSLCVENQIWRNLAQSNEAAAISLRNNLEQVLAHACGERPPPTDAIVEDDAESCCDSNRKESVGGGRLGLCRKCGEKEVSILLLPCRHLCLCGSCGSDLHICPVCNTAMNASLRVNLS